MIDPHPERNSTDIMSTTTSSLNGPKIAGVFHPDADITESSSTSTTTSSTTLPAEEFPEDAGLYMTKTRKIVFNYTSTIFLLYEILKAHNVLLEYLQ